MDAIGLWAIAGKTPDQAAVVEPDGRAVTYAELAAEADRYGRGLQALGLRPADSVAALLPNSATALAVYFAAIETGLYVVPVNWHLAAAEVAYIVSDSEAKVLHRPRAVRRDRRRGRRPGRGRAPVRGRGGAGFRAAGRAGDDGQAAPPGRRGRTARRCSTRRAPPGRPKGVRRPLTGMDPDDAAAMATWFFSLFGLPPFDGNVHLCGSPLYHTAVLNFAGELASSSVIRWC